jgi:hypothetical protein
MQISEDGTMKTSGKGRLKKGAVVVAVGSLAGLGLTMGAAQADPNGNVWDALRALTDRVEALEESPPETVGLSHWSEGGTVPPANKPFTEADPTDPTYMPGYVEIVAECQKPDHKAIAGGYKAGSYKGGVVATLDRNTAGAPGTDEYAAGWIVGYTNFTDRPQTVRTWVVCAEVVEDEPKG